MTARVRATQDVCEQQLFVKQLAESLAGSLGAAAPSPTDLLEALADTGMQLRADSGEVAWRTYQWTLQRAAGPQLVVPA